MTSEIASITFDATDASELAGFWSAVLDRPVADGANQFFARIDGTPMMMFIAVPEAKAARNRCHLDLVAQDRADEVERLRFIRRLKAFGLSLAEIKELNAVHGLAGSTRDMLVRLEELLSGHLADVYGRLGELMKLRDEMEKYRDHVRERVEQLTDAGDRA